MLSCCLSIDSGLFRKAKISPRRMKRDLALVTMAGRSSSKMSESRLSSTNMEFRLWTHIPSIKTPMLRWSAVAFTMTFKHLSVSGRRPIKSISSLCLWTICSRLGEDWRCSTSLQCDCANTSQLWGTIVGPKDHDDWHIKCLPKQVGVWCGNLGIEFHVADSTRCIIVED